MLCPGCANELENVSVLGMDESFRCPNCGGYWIQNWVVNALAEGKPLLVAQKAAKLPVGGTNSCPTDGWVLNSPPAEVIPQGFVAGVCNACHWWWLPGDGLFKYSEAMKAKKSFEQQWHPQDWKKAALPALVLVLAVGAVAISVKVVGQRQQANVSADEEISQLNVVQVGPGMVEIRFTTKTPLTVVQYRKKTDREYKVAATTIENNMYVVKLDGLEPGEYTYQIFGRDYVFLVALY